MIKVEEKLMSNGFSVLMSVYNKENAEHFDLSLNSILVKQTRCPDEFILVCDGPLTKQLNTVIEKYEKMFPQILRIFRKETNQGLGEALRFGLLQCNYPLVARADSDDVCVEDRFEVQLRFMEQHPDISIISSYIDEFDDDWEKPNNIKTCPLEHEKLKKYAKVRNPLNHMAVMFRKSDIIEVGNYRHVPYTEDYDLWLRAIINGKKLGNIDRILVHARVGNGRITRRSNKAHITSWKQLNQYMYENSFITYRERIRNMLNIRVFVYMPKFLKKILYDKVLRKKVMHKNGN